MVEHGVDVGRENGAVMLVDMYGGIGPPEECLGHVGAVVEHSLYLQIRTAGAEGEACRSALMKHPLHFVDPYGHGAVGVFLYSGINLHICGRAMVLGPVELDTARNPRAGEAHERGLYDMVVVNEVALTDFVVGHLHAASQFGKNHHFDILVFQEHGMPLMVGLFVGHRLYHGIGIDYTA